MRRPLAVVAALAVLALVVVGALQAGGEAREDAGTPRAFDLRAALDGLEGAPPPLARLHAKASRLLPQDELRATLRDLRGTPVVVNKWGSWCPPCREEWHVLQAVSADLGREVAFIGLDGQDNADDARAFLRRQPTPYPHFEDPDVRESRRLEATQTFPNTIFIGADGEVEYVKQGQYRTRAHLRRDIERYAR